MKLMFKPVRIVATGLMVGCFIMVWISAFAIDVPFLALIFCILLYLSYLWYALSYVPGARAFIKNIFSKVI